MTGFPILDLVAGIIFIFFLLSIICSSAVEMILTLTKVRATMMEKWLIKIFDDELAKEIMNHSSLSALSEDDKATSYMDAKNFVTVLLEKITYNSNEPDKIVTKLDEVIVCLQDTKRLPAPLKRAFLVYAAEAKESYLVLSTKVGNVESEMSLFRGKIETWFNSSMDRVSGALKANHSRVLTFWIGVFMVLVLNADMISMAKYLYNNPEARIALAAKAENATKDTAFIAKVGSLRMRALEKDTSITGKTDTSFEYIEQKIRTELSEINTTKAALQSSIPLSWNKAEFSGLKDCDDWFLFILSKLAGLTVTVFAIMMGAPFWFDVLNKISNLRGAGKKPDEGKGAN